MDEDLSIINANTRNEKIKKFLSGNKKKLISILLILLITFISVYSYDKYKVNQKKLISNKYNLTLLQYSKNSKENSVKNLIEIINTKDSTYSPLSLYFIIDNKLISDFNKVNNLFDILIQKTSLDKEIKNLIIYKKGLFNADKVEENDLLNILNPVINSKSVWKSHSLYLIAEYFYSKDQKKKSKEFFNQIINLENANRNILQLSNQRLNRDLSD